MNKYAIVNNGKVKDVFVSSREPRVNLKGGDLLYEVSGKIKIGDDYLLDAVAGKIMEKQSKRSYKDIAIGAAVSAATGGAALAAYYFGGF